MARTSQAAVGGSLEDTNPGMAAYPAYSRPHQNSNHMRIEGNTSGKGDYCCDGSVGYGAGDLWNGGLGHDTYSQCIHRGSGAAKYPGQTSPSVGMRLNQQAPVQVLDVHGVRHSPPSHAGVAGAGWCGAQTPYTIPNNVSPVCCLLLSFYAEAYF